MVTKIYEQYQTDYYFKSILALPNGQLIGFCSSKEKDKSNKFLLLENGKVEILNYTFKDVNDQFAILKPALFLVKGGFGCVFYNQVVFCDLNSKKFKTLPIKNNFSKFKNGTTIEPIKAVLGRNKNEIIVLQNNEFHKQNGTYITELSFNESEAKYAKLFFNLPTESENIEISDIVCKNSEILFHSIGQIKNYSRYGMDYSKIGKLETKRSLFLKKVEHHFIKGVADGYGIFSSDSKHLVLISLKTPKKIEFYNLSGHKQEELMLTPKKVLGKVDKNTKLIDKFDGRLWLANETGEVTELSIQL